MPAKWRPQDGSWRPVRWRLGTEIEASSSYFVIGHRDGACDFLSVISCCFALFLEIACLYIACEGRGRGDGVTQGVMGRLMGERERWY